ncbi:MAG: anti-sigma regulatory factor [Ruminococcaceae bacterium]|nr:anti-sigma regulatory factor [Oscillospiraceae bacterium]
MSDALKFEYKISGENFASAGEATMRIKKELRSLGFTPALIRRVSIAMYEGEINMVIHAGGGVATVLVYPECVEITLADQGPGIADISLAMQEGYTTAPDAIRSFGFGAGMGLPNMKKYTDDMRIESELNKGTTVYMKINA